MIVFFSGTGNSAYAARRLGGAIGDEVTDLFEKIRDRDRTPLRSDRPWIVVAPTYAWRIPRIVQDWLEKTALTGSRELYFVMTCGGSIGNAGRYLEKLTAAKGMLYKGCFPVVMPENYAALFDTPTREQAEEIVGRARPEIDKAAKYIAEGKAFPPVKTVWRDKVCSGIVNRLYYPMVVHAKKFYSTDACISCGKCAAVCPLENIRLEQGRPRWGKDCTHCMACICRCPTEAIEYGGRKAAAKYTWETEELPRVR